MDDDRHGQAENYTEAFLWTCYLVVVVLLVILWGAYGYIVAVAACGGLHWGVGRFVTYRAAREAEWEARVAAAVARGWQEARRRG
jgi:hypothetical protein